MADSGIYEIVNIVNGKRYVGSAVNLPHRWREHRWALNGSRHGNRHLQASWLRHGEDAFEFQIIELCDPSRLIEREQAAINRLKPEYNICPVAGSTLGRSHTDEAKAKIGARLRGKPRDPEVVAGIADKLRGRKRPDLSEALKGNKHAAGTVHTEDRRRAISAELKRQYDEGLRSRERPEQYREKIATTLRKRSQDPDIRERLRRQASEAWADRPKEERQRHMAMVRAARGEVTAEQRQAISDRQRGRPMKPHVAAALLAANKGRKHSPEVVAARAERLREWWTPERKKQRAEAMRAYHAKRKAAHSE